MSLFFLGGDDILRGLGGKSFDDLLGRDLDGGAGLGVAADEGLAGLDLDGDETGDGKLSSFLMALAASSQSSVRTIPACFFGDGGLFSQVGVDL